MSGIYTSKEPTLEDLSDVQTQNVSNNDHIRYDATSTNWKNQSDFITDEIDCRVLRVSQTANIEGRLANVGVASFVNDEFVFQNGISNLGQVLYLNNTDNLIGINKSIPEHALDVVGHIRLGSSGSERLIFNNTTLGLDIADNDAILDGNGGIWGVRTKVDGGSLTEKLRINNTGAIGIAGANYGTAGSVLTSNGSGSSPSWVEPYNISYSLTSNTADQTSDTEFKITGFTTNLLSTTNSDFSTTNDRWTPSNAGIYLVNIMVRSQRNQDAIIRIDTHIKKSNTTNIFSSVIDLKGTATDADDLHVFSPTINAMVEVSSADITGGAYYEFFAKIKSKDASSVKVLGTNNYTYFYIHKIA
jgi:hypothetical protein